MTIGSITTGSANVPYPRQHYCKTWNGQDGKTVTTRFTRKPKWNNYIMCMGRLKSGGNSVGVIDGNGVYSVRTNHSWANLGGDPGTEGYRTTVGSTSFPIAFPESQFSLFWTAREDYILLARLLKKIKGHELNLGVALAEVDKLAGTVLGTIKTLVFGVEDLAKGNFARFARRFGASPPTRDVVKKLRLRDISGRFLEMRYAWTPAIADAYEAAKAFEALSNGPRQTTYHKAYRKGRSLKYSTNYCAGIPQQVTVSKAYLFEMYEEMSAARQMGLANPATIIWERLPWSFVVDWFIPVGTYLELIGQVPFMKGRWLQTRTIRWNSAGTCTQRGSSWTPAPPHPTCDWERFHLERSNIGNPGVPFPSFKVAGAVHGKRIGNAIALAHQVFNKALDGYTKGATWY